MKKGTGLLLGGAMAMVLTGCSGSQLKEEDASKCVQVELDATYKGQFDGMVDFYTNVTAEDGREQYDANVQGEAYNFLTGLGPDNVDGTGAVEPTELQLHRAYGIFEDIYAQSKYTIVSSTKQSDGTFAVKVSVEPLDIIHLLDENYEEGFEEFWTKFDAVDVEGMSDEEFETWYEDTFAEEYYDTLMDVLEAQVDDMGYLDEKSIVIQVQQDEDGSLFFSDEDWMNLDALIIDYNL